MQSFLSIRVAWLLPVAWFYWQPSLSEFARLFPNTTVFTGLFPGFAQGLEGTLQIEVVGKFRVIEVNRDDSSYGDNFTYLSPSILWHLFKLRPQVIFSSSFGVWTILVLMLKPLMGWRAIIAYEGSSPGVDYRHSALRLFVRRAMVWLTDACITNSWAGRAYLIDVLNAKPERVFLQPYEIPDEKTLPASSQGIEESISWLPRPMFLFVGQVVPRKGLQSLLKACAVLKDRGYENYTLLVVGDGFQRKELETFCWEHQLSDRVNWVGSVSYDQIGSYFKDADIFIFPTLEDTWGVVSLEAMLLGKPIICSKGAGTSELVHHGENGYVFSPNNENELANLMQEFLDNPNLISIMGEQSQKIMMQFTPQEAAQCMARIVSLVTT
ncbi:glycosyl transferase group 1 [Stanieria sp. NIES-3757]|nr:glycosyl transferase group 1 [Stanieria sp. NIES-3757]